MTEKKSSGNVSHLDAISAVQKQSAAILRNEPHQIAVPEWPIDGRPMVLHVWPATIGEEAEINARRTDAVKTGRDPAYEEILATLIVRARNKDRSRVFDFAQLPELREAMGDTIRRVVREINAVGLTPEEIQGN